MIIENTTVALARQQGTEQILHLSAGKQPR